MHPDAHPSEDAHLRKSWVRPVDREQVVWDGEPFNAGNCVHVYSE
jgi:hypothetical protein